MQYENLTINEISKLIDKNRKKRKDEFDVKVEKIMRKIQKEIILKNYFIKNSSINIFQRIIQLCLTDINISGIVKTNLNEEIFYKREENFIELKHLNKFKRVKI